MSAKRPDLSNAPAELVAYIQELESELALLRSGRGRMPTARTKPLVLQDEQDSIPAGVPDEPAEAPTSINVICMTAHGIAKRTPRHYYNRQHRGGMGIFDLETGPGDPPAILALADESQHLLLLTNYGRAFRIPVKSIPERPVRSKSETITGKFNLLDGEKMVSLLTDQAQGYVVLLSQTGMVRLLRHHVFGEHMKPGTQLVDQRQFGDLVSASRSDGNSDLFIATRLGKAIRFAEKSVPPTGNHAIRLSNNDLAVSVTSVRDQSSVFMLGSDGKGIIRQMQGFLANKAPGAGGKIAFSSDHLVCAINVDDQEDIFIISAQSKIIRFRVDEIPTKEGAVQGVFCMSLRADQPVAACTSPGQSSI